jgi:hypothetical protein
MCTHASTLTMCTSKKMAHGSTDDRQAPERKLWGSRLAGCAVPCLNPIEYTNKQSEQTNRANPNTKTISFIPNPHCWAGGAASVRFAFQTHPQPDCVLCTQIEHTNKCTTNTCTRTLVPEHMFKKIIIILCAKLCFCPNSLIR